MIETIRKLAFEEFIAAISTRSVTSKSFKRVYLGYFLKIDIVSGDYFG